MIRIMRYRQRAGVMLVTVLVLIAIIAVFSSLMMINANTQIKRSQQQLQNAQIDVAAVALAASPADVTRLNLPDGRIAQVEQDRVQLTTPDGRILAAVQRQSAVVSDEESQ